MLDLNNLHNFFPQNSSKMIFRLSASVSKLYGSNGRNGLDNCMIGHSNILGGDGHVITHKTCNMAVNSDSFYVFYG